MCVCARTYIFPAIRPSSEKEASLLPCREGEGKIDDSQKTPIPSPVSPRPQKLKSVHASITMPRTIVALVLAIGALAGRINAQGNRSVRASVNA